MHTTTPPQSAPGPVLTGLGQALRWLRERQARKQYQVASDAGITKGMLSAYETGRQRPSLETLGKLLETLTCDLNDLHNALQIVNGRPEQMKGWRGGGLTLGGLGGLGVPPELDPAGAAWPGAFRDAAQGAYRTAWPPPPASEAWAALPAFTSEVHEPSGPAAPNELAVPKEPVVSAGPGGPATPDIGRAARALHQLLGLLDPSDPHRQDQAPVLPHQALPREQELAMVQMLEGFHNLLRYWHRCLTALAAGRPPEARDRRDPVTVPALREQTEPSAPALPPPAEDQAPAAARREVASRRQPAAARGVRPRRKDADREELG